MPQDDSSRAEGAPTQVYLDESDQSLLERVARVTGLPRAEVLRRGLRRYAAELCANESPALAFLNDESGASSSEAPADVALRHDDYLTDWDSAVASPH